LEAEKVGISAEKEGKEIYMEGYKAQGQGLLSSYIDRRCSHNFYYYTDWSCRRVVRGPIIIPSSQNSKMVICRE